MFISTHAADAVKKASPSLYGPSVWTSAEAICFAPCPLWCTNFKGQVSKPDLFFASGVTHSRHTCHLFLSLRSRLCAGLRVGSPSLKAGAAVCLQPFDRTGHLL